MPERPRSEDARRRRRDRRDAAGSAAAPLPARPRLRASPRLDHPARDAAAVPPFRSAPLHAEPDLPRRPLRADRALLGSAHREPHPQPRQPALLARHPAGGAASGELPLARRPRAGQPNPADPPGRDRPRAGRLRGSAAGRRRHPPRLEPLRRARDQPACVLAPVRRLPGLRPRGADLARDAPRLPFRRRAAPAAGAAAVKRLAPCALLLVACATSGAPRPPASKTHDGTAHVSGSGVQVEVGSFPLAGAAQPSTCRDAAQKRLATLQQRADEADRKRAPDLPAQADAPRDQSNGDSPTATWSFTRGPSAASVRSRWGFFARGADCLMLQVSGPRGDGFADRVFDSAARTFKVLSLAPEQQREVDLLAGMGFLERREPAAALDRFEALARREPGFAKAHFGALMAAFELGPQAYARGLPHGRASLKGDRTVASRRSRS